MDSATESSLYMDVCLCQDLDTEANSTTYGSVVAIMGCKDSETGEIL